MKATKEIDCAAEKESMTEAQYKRFLPHRTAMAESKAFMRALRAALGLAATYSLPELRKPFIIAHVVPNLDAPEIKEAVASNYLQSMGMLFEGAGAPRAALPAAQTTAEVIPDDGADGGYEAGGMPGGAGRRPGLRRPGRHLLRRLRGANRRDQSKGRTHLDAREHQRVQRAQVRTMPLHPLPEGGEGREGRPISMTEQHIAVCEALDWRVHDDLEEDYVELEKYSPPEKTSSSAFRRGISSRTSVSTPDDFDVDEHVELWIEGRGKNGAPATARELVEDAEAIRDMLNELAVALTVASEKKGAPS